MRTEVQHLLPESIVDTGCRQIELLSEWAPEHEHCCCQAITRAKRALWVCGNAATLRSSDVWDALVE